MKLWEMGGFFHIDLSGDDRELIDGDDCEVFFGKLFAEVICCR